MKNRSYQFKAQTFARLWLAVEGAASDDPARPLLHRTVGVECYDAGIRIVSTNSYMLAHSSIGEVPDLSETTEQKVVVEDTAGLLRKLCKIALGRRISPDAAVTFDIPRDGQSVKVWLEIGDSEHGVRLSVPPGVYPDWRSLLTHDDPASAERVHLNPKFLGRVTAMAAYLSPGQYSPTPLRIETFGPSHAVAFHIRNEQIGEASWLQMPVRVA